MSRDEIESRFDLLDKAAKKSDRWWFLALLIIGMLYAGWIQFENKKDLAGLRDENKSLHIQLETNLSENNLRIAELLARNTIALEENTRMLSRIK